MPRKMPNKGRAPVDGLIVCAGSGQRFLWVKEMSEESVACRMALTASTSNSPYVSAGKLVRSIRQARALSISQLSDLSGIVSDDLRRIERGEIKIADKDYGALSESLQIRVDLFAQCLFPHYYPLLAYWLSPDSPPRQYAVGKDAQRLLQQTPIASPKVAF